MKKYLISGATALALLAVSCEKNPVIVPAGELTACKITASVENTTRTVLNGSSVYWTPSDKLFVFGKNDLNGIEGVEFVNSLTDDAATAEFSSTEWKSGLVPVYATNTSAPLSKVSATAEGIVTTWINPVQVFDRTDSFAPGANSSVGKVTDNGGVYEISEMKNVTSLLKVNVSGDNVAKITVFAPGGEAVAGYVNADLSGSDVAISASEGVETVTMLPSSGSSFAQGDYYACLIPQTYSRGLRIKLTDTDGKITVRTVSSAGLILARSKYRDFDRSIDDGVTYSDGSDITINLDFASSWPFDDTCAKKTEQTENGEEYTLDGYKFTISKGTYTNNIPYYNYEDGKYLNFAYGTSAWIKLPAIPGYYLYSVSVTNPTAGKKWIINDSADDETALSSVQAHTDTETTKTVTFSADDPIQMGQSLYMYLTNGNNFRPTNITLVYKQSLPLTLNLTKINSSTFKLSSNNDPLPLRNTPETIKTVFDFYFTQNGQDYTFTSMGNAEANLWGNYLGIETAGYVKLPKISGYKLVSITDFVIDNGDNRGWSICTDTDGSVAPGGELKTLVGTPSVPVSWVLTDSYSGTDYYFRAHNKSSRANFKLNYMKVTDL